MNYTITRDGQQYGPYTLADLQRYAASGEVLLTDLAISDGMSEPAPVSQIIGTISVPLVATTFPIEEGRAAFYPNPPNLHWGWLILLVVLTRGIFALVWSLVLAIWVKKVEPKSTVIYYYVAAAFFYGMVFLSGVLSAAFGRANVQVMVGFSLLIFLVINLVARFKLRSALEDHYNNSEGIPLALSGVMTFFFECMYFQYHVNDIVRRKKAEAAELATR